MNKEIIKNRYTKDFNMLGDIFGVFKLANKYFNNICVKNNIKEVEFEVLYLLYTSKNKKMKMSLLGDNLQMARSGVTLLVDRMALEGLIRRRQDIDDRRITNVIITEKGNEIMENIFHKDSIFKLSPLDFMQEEEKEILYKLVIKIKEKLQIQKN
jgi:DNA-binding MarR family transcriptional regulator